MPAVLLVAALIVAYLVGALPTSYLLGKALKGIDIREHGSGNAGATNVARVVGAWPGLVVLLVDIGKGWAAAAPLASWASAAGAAGSRQTLQAVLGFSAVCGHIWSPFLAFQGGKGVATAAGVLFGLDRLAALLAVLVWGATALLTRYVSVSSIAAVMAVPCWLAVTARPASWVLVSVALCLIIVAKHRANLGRLWRHEEHRLGSPRN